MSELTAALETIFSWLKANYPKLEQSYQPGLSYEEIKSYDDKLGDYCLTSEFYELYQWRNGTLAYPEQEIIQIDDNFYIFDYKNGLNSLENNNNILFSVDSIEPFLVIYFHPIRYVKSIKYLSIEDNQIWDNFLYPFFFSSYEGNEIILPENKKDTTPLASKHPDSDYLHRNIL